MSTLDLKIKPVLDSEFTHHRKIASPRKGNPFELQQKNQSIPPKSNRQQVAKVLVPS